MEKMNEFLEAIKMSELLQKKEKKNVLVCVLAVIGAVVVVAGIAYAVYRYMTPDYLEDFDDDFDDEFEDEEYEEAAPADETVGQEAPAEEAEPAAEETTAE